MGTKLVKAFRGLQGPFNGNFLVPSLYHVGLSCSLGPCRCRRLFWFADRLDFYATSARVVEVPFGSIVEQFMESIEPSTLTIGDRQFWEKHMETLAWRAVRQAWPFEPGTIVVAENSILRAQRSRGKNHAGPDQTRVVEKPPRPEWERWDFDPDPLDDCNLLSTPEIATAQNVTPRRPGRKKKLTAC